MIVENALGQHGYARVILAQVHASEYPAPQSRGLRFRTEVVWDGGAIRSLAEQMNGGWGKPYDHPLNEQAEQAIHAGFRAFFPGFWEKYNEHGYADYNGGVDDQDEMAPQITLTLLHGELVDLEDVLDGMCASLAGPMGGDDSTYDDWPSEFGSAVVLAYDLAELSPAENAQNYYLEKLRKVWDEQATTRDWNPEDFGSEVTARP